MSPMRYTQVLALLNQRAPKFVAEQWRRAGYDYSRICQITNAIAATMDFPADRILPDDQLLDVMNDETWEFSVVEISERLEQIDSSFRLIVWNDKKWLSSSVRDLIPESGYWL